MICALPLSRVFESRFATVLFLASQCLKLCDRDLYPRPSNHLLSNCLALGVPIMPGSVKLIDSTLITVLNNGEREIERGLASRPIPSVPPSCCWHDPAHSNSARCSRH